MDKILQQNKKIIIIVGPTCSGKSKLAIALSKEVNGEIISADSLQVYKHLTIGTAKLSLSEMEGVPHHVIDLISPDVDFTAKHFADAADCAIDVIIKNGHVPIIVGGTFFYIKALLYGVFETEEETKVELLKQFRKKIELLKKRVDHDFFYCWLCRIDPVTAKRLHPNDHYRVIRAIEVYVINNKEKTVTDISVNHEQKKTPRYDYVKIGLDVPRPVLYDRINQRVDDMMASGFVEEVKSILDMGYSKELKCLNAIGYKECIQFLDGHLTLDKATELIKQNTRRFAKRQMTWLRSENDIYWWTIT